VILIVLLASLAVIGVLALVHLKTRKNLKQSRAVIDSLRSHDGDKTRFMAHVSHEIRTPLNGIIGISTLLSQPGLSPSEDQRLRGLLSASAQQLLELVNDVLDISKLEAGKMTLLLEDLVLRNWIESVLFPQRILARKKGLQIEVNYEGDSRLKVRADLGKLTQVLNNLVANAIKFTDQGRIQVFVRSPDKLPGYLVLRVQDTGIGMSGATQGRLFNPFSQADLSSTRKYGGTGLGLFIVKELVALMEGRIFVASEVGVGSVFEVEIPLMPAEVVGPSVTTVVPSSSSGRTPTKLRCLVVDDDSTNRLVLGRFLEKLGCEIVACENGLQAVEHAGRTSFDAIFMDCEMPVMDGFSATGAIRKQEMPSSRSFIVAVTAGVGPEDNARCIDSGMDMYLPKPFTIDQLRIALDKIPKKSAA
jgi:CheY-like chemotaxis protein/nitrogen-specific signal transduction histidine kinase